jgi:hypothetical protein
MYQEALGSPNCPVVMSFGGDGFPRQTFLLGSGLELATVGSYELYFIPRRSSGSDESDERFRRRPPAGESMMVGCVLVPGGFQYKTKELFVDSFGKGILAVEVSGGVCPQLKTFSCPRKGGMKTPLGKVTVSKSVSVAVPLQGSFALFVALMVTGKTPVAVGVPEICPGSGPGIKPWGRSVAL